MCQIVMLLEFLPFSSFLALPHLVLVALAHLAELPAELDVDLEVEVALVPLVRLHCEVATQLLSLEKMISEPFET